MVKIKRIGPDGMIYLPRAIIEACGWSEQETVVLETDGEKIVLKRWEPENDT